MDHYVTAALAEYDALRAELRATIDRQYPVLNWAITAIGLSISAFLATTTRIGDNAWLVYVMFSVVLPGMATAFLVTWLFIIINMADMGAFLAGVECKIEYLCGSLPFDDVTAPLEGTSTNVVIANRLRTAPVSWERSVWQEDKHPYFAAVTTWGFYLLLVAFGLMLVASLVLAQPWPLAWSDSGTRAALACIVTFLAWYILLRRVFRMADSDIARAESKAKRLTAMFDPPARQDSTAE